MTDAVFAHGEGTFRVAAVRCALLASTLVTRLRDEGDAGLLAGLGMRVVLVGLACGLGWCGPDGMGGPRGERGLLPAAWNVVDMVPFASFMGIGLAAGACASRRSDVLRYRGGSALCRRSLP